MIKHENNAENWLYLTNKVEKFQEITRVLIDFEERKQSHQKLLQPELHLIRKAVTICAPEELHIYLHHLGGYIYKVIASYQSEQGHFTTIWIHEDGIKAERSGLNSNPGHPVHKIMCLTDLYENECKKIPLYDICQYALPYVENGYSQDIILYD